MDQIQIILFMGQWVIRVSDDDPVATLTHTIIPSLLYANYQQMFGAMHEG